jgi:hypothetical protein
MGEGPVRVRIELVRTPSGRERGVARLGDGDALAYERSVAAVVPAVERVLGDAVLAERVAGRGAIAWTRPEPWWPARRGFREARTASGAPATDAILRTDVRDCYRSIAPSSVDLALAALGCGRADRAPILRFLERCSSAGLRGLPVGPTPSAVLANAVLAPVDAAIAGRGLRHVRWVDDVLVALPAGADAASVLDHIADELERWGLRPNPAKTAVLAPGGAPAARSGPRRVR